MIDHVCNGLQLGFGNSFIRDLRHGSHPLGAQTVLRFGRWALFRLGAALACYPVSAATREDLRSTERYVDIVAERDFGLFLASCGHAVRHEPSWPRRGPDYSVKCPARPVAFEVKHAHLSKHFSKLEKLAWRLSMDAQQFVGIVFRSSPALGRISRFHEATFFRRIACSLQNQARRRVPDDSMRANSVLPTDQGRFPRSAR